jgi:hypothetical protein
MFGIWIACKSVVSKYGMFVSIMQNKSALLYEEEHFDKSVLFIRVTRLLGIVLLFIRFCSFSWQDPLNFALRSGEVSDIGDSNKKTRLCHTFYGKHEHIESVLFPFYRISFINLECTISSGSLNSNPFARIWAWGSANPTKGM